MTKEEFLRLRFGDRVKSGYKARPRSVTYIYDDPSGARVVSLSAIQGCTKSMTNLDYGAPDHYVNWDLVRSAEDIALRPEPDGACRVDFSDDGAKAAFHKWAKTKGRAREAFKGWVKAQDAFQITVVGMHKIAEAERRAFRLKADQSEHEAELLRRDGSLDRAKKFLEQETKWRAKMAQSDEAIYKDYKAQGRDSRSGIGKNTVKMAHEAGESVKKDVIAKGASKEEAQAAYQKVYMATLSQLLSGGSAYAKDGLVTTSVLSPLVYLAALYGLWKFLQSKDKEPGFYDFSKYQR